jgi:hypothetical protein
MKFDSNLIDETTSNLLKYFSKPEEYKKYSFDLPEGFNMVPVIEQVRSYSQILVKEDKIEIGEKITRIMIAGKPIEIFVDDESLGKFIMNGDASWDSIPQLTKHPFALNSLIEVCLGDLMGKFLPPLKNTKKIVQVEAKKTEEID